MRFDAVIAGAGPAGSAAALALARAGRSVLLAEAAAGRPGFQVGESLPAAARRVLRTLGAEHALEGLPCYGTVSAWGSARTRESDSVWDPDGHGWHLDRAAFDASLRAAAQAAGAVLRSGWEVRVADRRVRVGEEEVGCGVLVDASGRRASAARALGARRERRDRLVGVYAAFRSIAGDEDARTLVEAGPGGWWYTALVPRGRRVVAFMTDADLVPREMRAPAGFCAALRDTQHVSALARGALELAPRTAPAHSGRLTPVAGERWLAAGDAAIAFDPLSSQGIFNALYTGMAAGQAADAWLGGDAGAPAAYAARVDAIDAGYRRGLDEFYALERRWPGSAFWQRRLAAQAA
jgi:flavin-dependent dehydrogenase